MHSLYIRIILITTLILVSIVNISAGEAEKKPMFSMGIGSSFGIYDTQNKDGIDTTRSGYGIGFGLIFEKMFNKHLGTQSGIWYTESYIKLKDENNQGDIEVEDSKAVFQTLTIPFYMLISAKAGRFNFGVLAGLNFSYMTKLDYYVKSSGQWYVDNFLKYMNYTQMGLGGGLQIKFGITRFIDIFVSFIGERYLTEINDADAGSDDGSSDYMYDMKIASGVMLRTF